MRRRSGRKSHADWVYRGFQWALDDPSDQADFLDGTYYNPVTLVAGQDNSIAQVLYDSHNFTTARLAAGVEAASGALIRQVIGAPASPDEAGYGALIHGSEIGIYIRTSGSWTGANEVYLGWRIIVAQQDPNTGVALLPPEYSMWQNVAGTQFSEPAQFANGRSNCYEERYFRPRYTTDTALDHFIHRKFVRYKRRLDADEAVFLYLELHANSVSLDLVNFWCRTLVTDDRR